MRTWRRFAVGAGLTVVTVAALVVPVPGRSHQAAGPIPDGLDTSVDIGPVRGAGPAAIRQLLGIDPTPAGSTAAPAAFVGPATVDRAKHYQCQNGHQTEDPLSPPCDTSSPPADNGGATYAGVTRDEVRVVVFTGGGFKPDAAATDRAQTPPGGFEDLGRPLPPGQVENAIGKTMRAWVGWYNQRYQTYGRYVHVVMAYDDPNRPYYKPDNRERYVNDQVARVQPFLETTGDFPMAQALAKRGVLALGAAQPPTGNTAGPGLVWPYAASVRARSADLAGYVCRRLAGRPVSFSGDPATQGRPRKFGLIYPAYGSDPVDPASGRLVQTDLEACGVHLTAVATHSGRCWALDTNDPPQEGLAAIARFKQAGVTTVIWPTCFDGEFAVPALALGYHPEWVLGQGDGTLEAKSWVSAMRYGSLWDRHAVLVANLPPVTPLPTRPCWRAAKAIDPTVRSSDVDLFCQFRQFDWLRELFDLIQVAGPRLGPASLLAGSQRLPKVSSPDPLAPSCVFYGDDLSCLKDGSALMWDNSASAPPYQTSNGVGQGCWRPLDADRRYLPRLWPLSDVALLLPARGPTPDCDLTDSPPQYRQPNLNLSQPWKRL